MINVLFVNHALSKFCGIHAHGVRMRNILFKSNKYNLCYVEVKNEIELESCITNLIPKIILYNTTPTLLSFCANQKSKYPNIKHVALSHDTMQLTIDSGYNNDFDAKIALDPTLVERNNWYTSVRPLFGYLGNPNKVNPIPTIGSFGFYFRHKGFHKILQLVANEFKQAKIRLHITEANFSDYLTKNEFKDFKIWAKSDFGLPNIKIEITDDYITDKEQIDFLSENDVNIFPYEYNYGMGPSSAIDYAVAAGKPIMVSQSWQFRHVVSRLPNIETHTITQAIMGGNSEVLKLRDEWSEEKFLKDYERIFNEVQNR